MASNVELVGKLSPSEEKESSTSLTSLSNGATILMIGQVLVKLMTFSLNQLLLQFITPTSIGLSSLIEFVINYLLFLSRESIRLSVTAIPPTTPNFKELIINLSHLPLLVYIIFNVPIFYFKLMQNETLSIVLGSQRSIALILIQLSMIVELLNEPMYNISQYQLNFKKRTKFESIGSFVKCISQFILVVELSKVRPSDAFKESNYVMSFIIGQFLYSLTITITYLLDYLKQYPLSSLLPRLVIVTATSESSNLTKESVYFHKQTLDYCKSLFLQLLFKNFLTEGDKFLITSLFTISQQGYYGIVTNYTGLIVRLVFLPIEESTRITVTKLFADTATQPDKKDVDGKIKLFNDSLKNIVCVYVYLLSMLLVFAPMNTRFLVTLLFKGFGRDAAGQDELIRVFKLYWLYIPFLASNGILEALLNSVFFSVKKQVSNYSKVMVVDSIVFLLNVIYLVRWCQLGLSGLILANIVNMGIRIGYCLWKLQGVLLRDSYDFRKLILFGGCCMMGAAVHICVIGWEVAGFKQFLMSAVIAVCLVGVIVILERQAVIGVVMKLLGKYAKRSKND